MRRTITAAATAALALGLIAGPAVAKPDKAGGPPAVDGSIVDTAVALNSEGAFAGVFDELIFAVTTLDLADTLDTKRNFTVFAPTDAAFEALAEALEIEESDGDDNDLVADDLVGELGAEFVTDVLLYHVAPGERFASDIIEGSKVNTLLKGEKISVTVDAADNVFLDGAQVIVPNVETSNGVIHAINAVLVP